MKPKRRPLKRSVTEKKVKVVINVKDDTQEEFLNDLSYKVNEVIKTRLAPVLIPSCGSIVGNLVRTYLVTQGLLTAAGEKTTEGYFIRAAVTLDVLHAILKESGIDLDADVVPVSIREEEYNKIFSENQEQTNAT